MNKNNGFKKGCIPWNKGKPAWNKGKRMKDIIKNYQNPFLNRKHSEKTKIKMRKLHTKFSQKTKEKMVLARLGDKNPMWKGGLSFGNYSLEFNKRLKKHIKQRDGNECKLCGTKKLLSVHHIDYDKKNTLESNLITLCQKCNPQMNVQRDLWSNYWNQFLFKTGGALSDRDIKKALKYKWIKIQSKGKIYIGPCSVDLRLSNTAKMIDYGKIKIIDVKDKNTIKYKTIKFKELIINPGEFYLLSTKEKITLNRNIAGFVFGRSSLARLGINVHLAGFVDVGFSGTITLEVVNMTKIPIKLYNDTRICQITFIPVTSSVDIDYGQKKDSKYQNQIKPENSKIYEDR